MIAAPATIAGPHVGSTDPIFPAVLAMHIPAALVHWSPKRSPPAPTNTGPGTSGTAAPTSSAWLPCAPPRAPWRHRAGSSPGPCSSWALRPSPSPPPADCGPPGSVVHVLGPGGLPRPVDRVLRHRRCGGQRPVVLPADRHPGPVRAFPGWVSAAVCARRRVPGVALNAGRIAARGELAQPRRDIRWVCYLASGIAAAATMPRWLALSSGCSRSAGGPHAAVGGGHRRDDRARRGTVSP